MTKKAQLSYTIELPHNYRANDIFVKRFPKHAPREMRKPLRNVLNPAPL